jgi:urease accessory protein
VEVTADRRILLATTPPVVLRRTGPSQLHLVQAAGGPLGGDQLELRLRLAEGTELTVRTAAATVAQPGVAGAGPATWTVHAEVGEAARLHWCPEPTVICDRARLHASFRLLLADGASALVREEVQLGRFGQLGGQYRGGLAVDYAGSPLVRHTLRLDGADPGLTGLAGTAGQRMVATVLGAGAQPPPAGIPAVGERDGLRWARHELPGPGWLLLALGSRRADLLALLAGLETFDARCGPAAGSAQQPVEPGDSGLPGLPGDPGRRSEQIEAVETARPHV